MAKTKTTQKRFGPKKIAPIGLWVSGIALIATILLSIVKLLAFAKVYTIQNPQTFTWILWVSAAIILLGLAAFALLDPQHVRELITGRQARYGSNALIMLVAFLGATAIRLILNALEGDDRRGGRRS